MSNNLEFMKEHNCKHLKNCKFASVVKYQYSDDKKGWYIQFGNVLHGIKYCPYCGMRLEDEKERLKWNEKNSVFPLQNTQ